MKRMILMTFVMLAFSNAIFASSSSSLSPNCEELFMRAFCKKICPHRCHTSSKGPTGPTGPTGPQGMTGPTGSQGIPGPSLETFISLYALGTQVVSNGDPILFSAVSAQNGSIIWPGTNNGEIVVSEAGIYQISFGVQIFNGRVSLRVNNVDVPGGTINLDFGLPFSELTLDVVLPANSTISLVNTSAGGAPITLQAGGSDPAATTAFIEIHQIL